MKNNKTYFAIAGLLLCNPLFAQQVKLAKVALGMAEVDVRNALGPSSPRYIESPSSASGLRYLIAETAEESFAFTFIDGHVAAFSLMHLLPAGQQSFLPPGQQPSVKILRELVVGQTWTPAAIKRGDTYWSSDAQGIPIVGNVACAPKSGEAWLPFGAAPDATSKATEGLMKPALVSYPANCGATIHLKESPSGSENDRVTEVQIQVLDVKAINEFVARR